MALFDFQLKGNVFDNVPTFHHASSGDIAISNWRDIRKGESIRLRLHDKDALVTVERVVPVLRGNGYSQVNFAFSDPTGSIEIVTAVGSTGTMSQPIIQALNVQSLPVRPEQPGIQLVGAWPRTLPATRRMPTIREMASSVPAENVDGLVEAMVRAYTSGENPDLRQFLAKPAEAQPAPAQSAPVKQKRRLIID